MQNEVDTYTHEKQLVIKYGDHRLIRPEREEAKGSFKYILEDMDDIRKSFIRLGFHLAEMKRMRYYEDFGYQTLEGFAAVNLGMDKSNVYRYIRVYENFAAPVERSFDGALCSVPSKFVLGDRWKDYSYSQLAEMCNMLPDERMVCKPDMTVKQLRELKKALTHSMRAVDMKNIAQRISEGATAAELKDEFKSMSDATGSTEKLVAMPPQKGKKDRSKEFSYEYCAGLHGAARAAYVKSRKSVGNAEIVIYDSEGRMVDFLFDPPAFNTMLEVLHSGNGRYVFRLQCDWDSFQCRLNPSLDQPDTLASNP